MDRIEVTRDARVAPADVARRLERGDADRIRPVGLHGFGVGRGHALPRADATAERLRGIAIEPPCHEDTDLRPHRSTVDDELRVDVEFLAAIGVATPIEPGAD